MGFETFDAFASWWEQLDPHWQNTLRAAAWGDMIAFTNTFDNTRIRLIFAKMFGGTPMISNLRAPGALKNAQLVFWDLDAGCSLHFLVGQNAWTNGTDPQFIRFGSSSHPLGKGQMAIGRSEYLYFDEAYLEARQKTGWVGIGAFMGVFGIVVGGPIYGVPGAVTTAWAGIDLLADLGMLVTEVAAPPPGPLFVHQGYPLDRRWQNLSSSHWGY